MEWDLGPRGLGLLVVMSVGAGAIAALLFGAARTRWIWLVAASSTYVVVAVFISEVWFGWATEEELQPNIDGLSFDEVLLGLVVGTIGFAIARSVIRHGRGTANERHAPLVRR